MEDKKMEVKYICSLRDKCPYEYDSCTNPKLFCRVLEDTPEHFFKNK